MKALTISKNSLKEEEYTDFLLLHLEESKNLQDYLWNRGIMIRGCSSFGLQKYVRLGIRLEEENQRLLAGIKNFLEGRS